MSDVAEILGQPFDPTQQEASTAWEPLVPGWYNAYVEKEEIKRTKAGDGYFLKLQFCIADGVYQNRKVFTNINIANPSAACVKIGKADLTALTQSLNIPMLTDTVQLLNGAVQIRVTIKRDQNEIKGYKLIGVITTAASVSPPLAAVPTAPAAMAPAPAVQSAPAPVAPVVQYGASGRPLPAKAPAPAEVSTSMQPTPLADQFSKQSLEPWKR